MPRKVYCTLHETYVACHIHTLLYIEFFIRESFQTKTPFYLECTTLLTWKSTIQVIHMLMLAPLCTCAWACTTRCVNVYKQHCEWWRSRCVNVCKQNCEWWRSRKSIYICFHMLNKRTLTTILMCLRSAGGSEATRCISSQDTLFCYVNSK